MEIGDSSPSKTIPDLVLQLCNDFSKSNHGKHRTS